MGYLKNAVKFRAAHFIRHQLVKNSYSDYITASTVFATEKAALNIENSELNIRLEKSLDRLPVKCRTAFVLNKLEQYPYKVVSEKMGISVKTVEKHISKALKLLRAELSDARSVFPFL